MPVLSEVENVKFRFGNFRDKKGIVTVSTDINVGSSIKKHMLKVFSVSSGSVVFFSHLTDLT